MVIDLTNTAIGTVIAQFSPPSSTREDLARYADASGDSNPLHLDIEFAKQAGFNDLVVHGMLNMAHLGRLLTDNFPPEQICNFNVRFEGVVIVGQSVTYVARVAEKTVEGVLLVLEGQVETGKRVLSGSALLIIKQA